MERGIDVSVYQGKISWKDVKSDNTSFALIRAGYGREVSQTDSMFAENYNGCKSVGLPCGAYWYSYAVTPDDARKEAEVFLKALRGRSFEYPVYFDMEEQRQFSLGASACTAIAEAFLSQLETAGFWAGIYSYRYALENYFTPQLLQRYAVWVAETDAAKTAYKYQYGIWQFSHKGSVKGINVPVDLNYSYIDYPSQMKSAGLNGMTAKGFSSVYTVKKGDSLWNIAQKMLGSGQRYQQIKVLNGLASDTIYPGQLLRLPPV